MSRNQDCRDPFKDRPQGVSPLPTDDPMIGVFGLGHVGLPTALAFAELGHTVIGCDADGPKVQAINDGRAPFAETGLDAKLKEQLDDGRFLATTDVALTVSQANVLFLCVGTPQSAEGPADLSQIDEVSEVIAGQLGDAYKLIVEKSTAPLYTAKRIKETVQRASDGRANFDVAVNPEFLREGTAFRDMMNPDRIVIGVESEQAKRMLVRLYEPLIERARLAQQAKAVEFVITDLNTAELIKYASNAFLATKLSFINMMSDLCRIGGADVTAVAGGMGADPRIGRSFLQAGVGYGGDCLPKDLVALWHTAQGLGVNADLLAAVALVNSQRLDVVEGILADELGDLSGRCVSIWGLAYKAGTDDIRETVSVRVIDSLLEAGATLRLHDPIAIPAMKAQRPGSEACAYHDSASEAAAGSCAIVLLTEWPEYGEQDWASIRSVMSEPALILDGRNMLESKVLEAAGFKYRSMGRP